MQRLNRKIRGRIRLMLFHAIEKGLGRKLSKWERANLKAGRALKINGCEKHLKQTITVQERRSQGRWLFCYGVTEEAARNGRLECGKRILAIVEEGSYELAIHLGRRGLPILNLLTKGTLDESGNWKTRDLPIEQKPLDDIIDRGS